MKNDKNSLQIINMLMQIILMFFDVFFSIFIYNISKNITLVFCYSIWQCLFCIIFEFIIIKIINQKNYILIYRLSFIFILISIGLIFTISDSSLFMVFVVQTFYACSLMMYFTPHEIAIMNKNTKQSMSKFVGVHQVLTLLAGVISPFLSGTIIKYISYPVLFIIISIFSLICFIVSFSIHGGVLSEPKIKFINFIKTAHSNKKIKYCYFSHALFNISQASSVNILLSLLLFMRSGTEFSVGIYSSIAMILSGIAITLTTKFLSYKRLYIIVSTIVLVLLSMMIVIFTDKLVFIIYYFIGTIMIKILTKYDAEMVYGAISGTEVDIYKKEHHLMFNIYGHSSRILSFSLAIAVYCLLKTELSLAIIIFAMTLIQIMSSYFMIKADE